MLEKTLVVFGTEFGRTPGAQGAIIIRRASPAGSPVAASSQGAFMARLMNWTSMPPSIRTRIQATVMHQLSLDPEKLDVPGRKRLNIHRDTPIKDIIG